MKRARVVTASRTTAAMTTDATEILQGGHAGWTAAWAAWDDSCADEARGSSVLTELDGDSSFAGGWPSWGATGSWRSTHDGATAYNAAAAHWTRTTTLRCTPKDGLKDVHRSARPTRSAPNKLLKRRSPVVVRAAMRVSTAAATVAPRRAALTLAALRVAVVVDE